MYRGNLVLPKYHATFRRKIFRRRVKRRNKDACRVVTANDVVNTAHEYSQNSSLHGLRYVGNKDLHLIERLFWVISFTLATCISGYFIEDLLHKWFDTPVIMSLSPKSTSLTTIPFPALTICNMNNVKKSIAEEILETNQTNLERRLLRDFCEEDTLLGSIMEDNVNSSWQQVQDFMVKASQPCYEMILSCKWHGERQNCDDIFNPTLTDEGMCCSFNKLKPELIFRNPSMFTNLNLTFPFTSIDWTPEKGYPSYAQLNHIPWRPWGAGSHLGLTVVLNADLAEYYCSSEASHGFKVTMHNPVETPKISAFGTLIGPGTETQMIITPTLNTATPQLLNIDQDTRQCFFSDEKELRYYRTYTQRNCNLECESNFTLYFCQCVMYYMPKDSTTRICGKRDMPCANRAKLAMETKIGPWVESNDTLWNMTQRPNCGCLPGCFSIVYDRKKFSSELSVHYKIKNEYILGRDPIYFRKNMAIVHFFFTDTQFTSIVKGELFGTTEMLSAAGGLLGLFMGFSFLSVFEVVYFLTLRLWCSVRKKRKIWHNEVECYISKFLPSTVYPFRK